MAIKDRITKKTTKTTTVRKKPKLRTGIEVLDFFEINKEISSLYVYDNNKIFLEKDGAISLTDEVFEISISDLIGVLLTKYENSVISVGDSYIIQTENGTIINIVSKPYLKSGNFISFKKKKMYDFSLEYLLKHQTLSVEIAECLKQKLENGENIFVAGSFDTNKLPVLSFLSGLNGENTAILQGTDEILTNSQNVLMFSKSYLSTKELISKAFSLSQNLVVSECETLEELMNILEYINSGYKHFISGINTGSKEEFINSIKNNIMLNYPQMSEEKIISLITSTIKTVVFLEKMKDGETRISHISEIEVINGTPKIKDIFEFDFAKFAFVKSKTVSEEVIQEEPQKEPEKKNNKTPKTKKVGIRKKRTAKTKPETPKQAKEKKVTEEQKQTEEQKTAEIPEIKETVKAPEPQKTEELPTLQVKQETEAEKEVQKPLPEPVIEPMKQLTQKVNKYKLLKEKIRQRKEQNI